MKALLRRSLVSVVGSVTLLCASSAFAKDGDPCYNDDDCENPACGGEVCNWAKQSPRPDGMKVFYCQTAGQEPKGMDGWCTTVDNCKCKATAGVMCVASHCTDTGTPIASGGSGAGGSAAGGSGTAGTGTTTAGTGGSAAGTGATTPAKEDSGGCSVGGSQNSGVATMALVLGALGLGVTLARRRR